MEAESAPSEHESVLNFAADNQKQIPCWYEGSGHATRPCNSIFLESLILALKPPSEQGNHSRPCAISVSISANRLLAIHSALQASHPLFSILCAGTSIHLKTFNWQGNRKYAGWITRESPMARFVPDENSMNFWSFSRT
jgi:hypothetical protein